MSWFAEIRRRKVFQIAVVYAVVAWLLVQIVATVEAPLNLPGWFDTATIVLLGVGFPIAVILSWAFDVTPAGVVRDDGETASRRPGSFRIEYLLIAAFALSIGWVLYRFELNPSDSVTVNTEQSDVLPSSVAILPFTNLSLDPEDAFFAAGLHDELLNQLRHIRALRVTSRTSVMRYSETDKSVRQIADELNVEAIMEGTVRYGGGNVRITTQLIDPVTEDGLWSAEYEEMFDIDNVLAIESDIAINIVRALQAELLPSEQRNIEKPSTTSPEAYQLYLKAVANYDDFEFWRANLERAIELDRDFARAYEEIAENYALVWRGAIEGWEQVVDEYSQKALDLDPTLSRARMARAMALEATWRWSDAEQAFRDAYDDDPNDPDVLLFYGRFKRVTGDYEESIRMLRRAIDLDPDGDGHIQLGITYKFAKQFDEAAIELRRAIQLSPTAKNLRIHLADAYIGRGDSEAALEELQTGDQLPLDLPYRLAQTMNAYSQLGRRDDVLRVYDELQAASSEQPVGEGTWAIAFLATGEDELALQHLANAVAALEAIDSQPLIALKANPWSLPTLEEPRFRELLDQVRG